MIRSRKHYWLGIVSAAVLAVGLTLPTASPLAKSGNNSGVIPPDDKAYGKSYREWSVKWAQWGLA